MTRCKCSMYRSVLILLAVSYSLLLNPVAAHAGGVQLNQALPVLAITSHGECVIDEGKAVFQPWSSDQQLGKLQIIEYVAARAGVDKVHEKFYIRLEHEDLLSQEIVVTKIVNASDALWGTSGLVVGEVKKNKLANPKYNLVVDKDGIGLALWGLKKKQANLIVINNRGVVIYFKDSALSQPELGDAFQLIRQNL